MPGEGAEVARFREALRKASRGGGTLEAILGALLEVPGVTAAALLRPSDGAAGGLEVVASRGRDTDVAGCLVAPTPVDAVFERRETVWSDAGSPAAREVDAAPAFVAAPLFGDGVLLGALAVCFDEPPPRTDELALAVEAFAAQASVALQLLDVASERASGEARMRSALDGAAVGVWEWDIRAGTVRWFNDVESIFGLPPGAFDGTYEAYRALLDDDARQRVDAAIARCVSGQAPGYLVEHRIVLPDGQERWLEGRGRAYLEAGEPVRLVGTVADITQRKRSERALHEEQAMKTAVLETSVMAVCVLSPQGQIIYANDRAEGILGLRKSELLERRYDAPEWKTTDVDGGPWPDEKQPFVRVSTTGEPVFDVRHAIVWPDGQRKILNINGAPIKDRDGSIVSLVFSIQDITAQLEAELERKRLQEQLIHAHRLEAVGRLAGGIAHDFNNLLTAILSCTHLAAKSSAPGGEVASLLGEIQLAGERASELTGQLLAFARKQVVEPRTIDVRDAIESVARLAGRLLGERVTLELGLGDEALPVRIDPGQLDQMLVNLLVNGRDAMPDGGSMSITARPDPDAPADAVEILVADTGMGMDRETIDHAFEPFFTTKGSGGTGLGLATCHGIARQAGGEISIDSAPGRGTTFRLRFPRARGPLQPIREEVRAPRPSGGRETILLVEDEEMVRRLAVMTLEEQGYRVLSAASGEEALALVGSSAGPVDLLLTDVVLPGMSGPAVAEALEARQPALAVLLVSGYIEDDAWRERNERAPAPFLRKPYRPAELTEKIREVLDRRTAA